MKYHILMADIIKSSRFDGAQLMPVFRKMVGEINKAKESAILSPLTITLGDEFQGVVASLKAGLDIIFDMDELLLDQSFQLRFILQYGEIRTTISKNNSYGMLGEGLTEARQQLDAIKETDKRILISGYGPHSDTLIGQGFQLYNYFYNQWSEKERLIVKEFLIGKDYKEVAAIFDKDISSMWRREKSLNIAEYKTAKEMIKLMAIHAA
jgi:hypothetical protein